MAYKDNPMNVKFIGMSAYPQNLTKNKLSQNSTIIKELALLFLPDIEKNAIEC